MTDGVFPLIGIFVGGAARRMGGFPKGLVTLDSGEPVIERTARIARDAFPDAPIVLVGQADAYGSLGLPALADDPPGIGPLGGLRALLRVGAAADRIVIALACDMPRLSPSLIARVAPSSPHHDAVAPRPHDLWQPLCAGYRSRPCLTAAEVVLAKGRRSLFAVLDELGPRAEALPVNEAEMSLLVDWDTAEDVERDGGSVEPR